MTRKLWKIKEISTEALEVSKKHNISLILAQILLNRDIKETDIDSFLNHSISGLHSPDLLPDMALAVERIKKAVRENEKVLVVGDYDVDGVTSLAIFHEFTKGFPDVFSFYIPHRVKEGYGLNNDVVKMAKEEKRSLIITFDCGTNSFEEIELAKSLGIDVVVIDHHHPKENLNTPFAFINPKRKDSSYPFSDLSSAALSFKLLQALKRDCCFSVLDLVGLSLVCDVAPLKGENRLLLKEGLCTIKKTERIAIKALCGISSLKQENIDTFHMGYILGPRINASGRVAYAKESLEIFLTDDAKIAYDIAAQLQEYNQLRKNIEAEILKEADALAERECLNDYAIVVHNEGWHQGVLGIVASRLADKYYRPSFVISFDEDVGRGSGRSIHSVHLMEVLDECAPFLQLYGGHRKAAGIQIGKKDLEAFKEKINSTISERVRSQDLIPVIEVDAKINFKDITPAFIEELKKLEPFGEQNLKPLFATAGVSKKSAPKKINSGYSVWLTEGGLTHEGTIYERELLDVMDFVETFDIVYSLEWNNYHNSARLVIRDVRFSGIDSKG